MAYEQNPQGYTGYVGYGGASSPQQLKMAYIQRALT